MPGIKISSSEQKKIEREYWKGKATHNDISYSPAAMYSRRWDNFLFRTSVEDEIINGKNIINVGGGHGKEAEFLSEMGANLIILNDIAPGQIKSAQVRKNQHGLHNLDLFISDAEQLPFKDKSFDIGYIYLALHHFPSHEKSISEICRVSRRVIFVDIMNPLITRILNLFGLYVKEGDKLVPNRLYEGEIKSIFTGRKMKMKIKYYFYPPYYGRNRAVLHIIDTFSILVNYFIKFKFVARTFGNIAIIKGAE